MTLPEILYLITGFFAGIVFTTIFVWWYVRREFW